MNIHRFSNGANVNIDLVTSVSGEKDGVVEIFIAGDPLGSRKVPADEWKAVETAERDRRNFAPKKYDIVKLIEAMDRLRNGIPSSIRVHY